MSNPGTLVLTVHVDPADPHKITAVRHVAGVRLCNTYTLQGLLSSLAHFVPTNAQYPAHDANRVSYDGCGWPFEGEDPEKGKEQ